MLHVMSFLFQPHSFVKMRTLNAIMDVWQIQLRVLCLDCQRHAVYKTQVGTEIVVIFVIFVLIVLNVFILFWIVCLSPILVTPMTHYPSPMTQPLAWPIEPCPAGWRRICFTLNYNIKAANYSAPVSRLVEEVEDLSLSNIFVSCSLLWLKLQHDRIYT